jgi:hypothetical protein
MAVDVGTRLRSNGKDLSRFPAAMLFFVMGAMVSTCSGRRPAPEDDARFWTACEGPGTCTVAPRGCCDFCGQTTLDDVDAVNVGSTMMAAHRKATCREPSASCPACSAPEEPNLVARCELGACVAFDVRDSNYSTCTMDEECIMANPSTGCEPCAEMLPDHVLALSTYRAAAYQSEVLGREPGCAACAQWFPTGYAGACSGAGRCEAKLVTCPANVPMDASSCTGPGQHCEYGTDPRIQCRTRATCNDGRWSVVGASCPMLVGPGEGGCPADISMGGVCSPNLLPCGECSLDHLLCDMRDDAVCACGTYMGDSHLRWRCAAAPGREGCPAYAPEIGSACIVRDLDCFYGLCFTSTGAGRRCERGIWNDSGVIVCPYP